MRVWAAGGAPCIYGAAWCASSRGRSPHGTRAKANRCDKVLQNGANCTGRRQLRTRTGGRSGRDAGCFVGTIVLGYAYSDRAIQIVAAPLLVSREAALTARVTKSRLDSHPEFEKFDFRGALLVFLAPQNTGVASSIRRHTA